jgi:hypothetical protein
MSGIEVLHASAVASAEGAIAICGVSGAGKSTLAHHLGDRGYPPIADDAVAWHLTEKRATVLRIPFRLRPEGGMPQIESTRRQQPPLEPSILDHDVPLHAIMVLQKAESGARAFRMKHIVSGSAFQALLPHAYAYRLDNETRMGRMLGDYMDLASAVPVFDARLRHDPVVLASALDQIENRVIACEHPAR